MVSPSAQPLRPVNIALQCTTKEMPQILYLLANLPKPYLEQPQTKSKFILVTDINLTDVEKSLIENVASEAKLSSFFQLCIESSNQDASESIYIRKPTPPSSKLRYGRKNGPNQCFFDTLSIAKKLSSSNAALTLLLEPDCIITKDGWLDLLVNSCLRSPGKLIYGCKPQADFLPQQWSRDFKDKFIRENGNRFNGVALYDTLHPSFDELVGNWSLLLQEFALKIDPVCAFDTLASSLETFRAKGRDTSKLQHGRLIDDFLDTYYSSSVQVDSIVDASAFNFRENIDRLKLLLNSNSVAIVHTKLDFETINNICQRTPSLELYKLSPSLELSRHPNYYLAKPAAEININKTSESKVNKYFLVQLLYLHQLTLQSPFITLRESTSILKNSNGYQPRFLFTIITVNLNNAAGLERTINSVKGQKYKNFQYIIIDGDSSDHSASMIRQNSGLIDIAVIEPDKGVYNAMNKGLDLALGKYILFLNSGDCLAADYTLLAVSDFVLENNHPSIIYGNTIFSASQSIWHANSNPLEIWKGMICSHQSIFISQPLACKFRFDEDLRIVADWKMIMHCILENTICKKINLVISEIEPVGISSDFTTRTLERWKIIRTKIQEDSLRSREIDGYYMRLLNEHSDVAVSNTIAPGKNIVVDNSIDNKLIFLISMPRSGSTLLQRILESSENISSCGEPWVALPPIAGWDTKITEARYELKLAKHAFSEASKELQLDKDTIKNAQKSYLDSIYSEFLGKTSGNYFLDKTPRYVHIIDELYSLFPGAKFILLTRQPSAIINSYASTWCNNDYNILLNHRSYMYDFAHGLKKLIHFSKQNKPNVLTISYEDLCSDSENVCAQISSFLGFRVTPNISSTVKATSRSLGDPKQINQTSTINANSVTTLGKQPSIKSPLAYDKICERIDQSVWEYFKNPKSVARKQSHTGFSKVNNLNSENLPSCSIVITCYNNSNTIINAIESVRNQILPVSEIIVIDDCSTDNSLDVIRDYIQLQNININLIKNCQNIGVSSSRHKAICSAKGDFVSTLDGDDTISPLKIAMEMKAIWKYNVEVAFSDIKLLTKDGSQFLNTRPYHKKTTERILNYLLTRAFPVPRDLTFSKRIYDKTGGFEESFNLFEDWMLKQKLAFSAGNHSWAHSGVHGTIYDRRNPGLSNKSPLQLIYAQLLVIGKNWHILRDHSIDFRGILNMLIKIDNNSAMPLVTILNKFLSPEELNKYLSKRFDSFHNRIRSYPDYLAGSGAIKSAIDSILL